MSAIAGHVSLLLFYTYKTIPIQLYSTSMFCFLACLQFTILNSFIAVVWLVVFANSVFQAHLKLCYLIPRSLFKIGLVKYLIEGSYGMPAANSREYKYTETLQAPLLIQSVASFWPPGVCTLFEDAL